MKHRTSIRCTSRYNPPVIELKVLYAVYFNSNWNWPRPPPRPRLPLRGGPHWIDTKDSQPHHPPGTLQQHQRQQQHRQLQDLTPRHHPQPAATTILPPDRGSGSYSRGNSRMTKSGTSTTRTYIYTVNKLLKNA